MTLVLRGELRWWDLSTVAVLLVALAFILLDEPGGDSPDQPLTLAILAAVLGLYVALGRAALNRARLNAPTARPDWVFLALLVGLVGAASATEPSLATLQVIAYPMLWTIVDRYALAVLWNVALALATGGGLAVAYARLGILEGRVVEVTLIALLSLAFSLAMGTWISQIFERGERHRVLAEQLGAAQAEVAALSEAAGAAAERERLSRDLHDTLTQTLTGMVMLADQATRFLAEGNTERSRERLDRVVAASREAMSEARALVATTQPLRDGGLVQALERVSVRLREDTGLDVRCDLSPVRVDREREVVLLRAAQEGLANARKHARARTVFVWLREEEGAAVLTIDDDGVGPGGAVMLAPQPQPEFPGPLTPSPDAPLPAAGVHGFGLEGLRDRVRLAGGEVVFGPRVEGGSRLDVRVPVSPGPLTPKESREVVPGSAAEGGRA